MQNLEQGTDKKSKASIVRKGDGKRKRDTQKGKIRAMMRYGIWRRSANFLLILATISLQFISGWS
jgi:hypothetical protein